MFKVRWAAGVMSFALATLAGCTPTTTPSSGGDTFREKPVAQELRDARERFNQAIVDRDLDAIRAVLAVDFHLVTGSSAQYHGAENHLDLWATNFDRDPEVVYRRTPREVRVNESWGLAEELGNWEGTFSAGNGITVRPSGVYAAKWQRATDGTWLLQSEVFTTLECDGPEEACRKPTPILR